MGIILGIDASNISSGGGLTHLVELLSSADVTRSIFGRVHIWCSQSTSDSLPQKEWLIVHTPRWCNQRVAVRAVCQQVLLPGCLHREKIDLLLSPGGIVPFITSSRVVSMCQNMLPFEDEEASLFGRLSKMTIKMKILKYLLTWSFRRSDGVIFLSDYALQEVEKKIGLGNRFLEVIPHGIHHRFRSSHRRNKGGAAKRDKIRILYVSIKMPYKHQIEVMEAVSMLTVKGYNIRLILAGQDSGDYGKSVEKKRFLLDPKGDTIIDLKHVDHSSIHSLYDTADIFVFASSCENMPNILLEAMASGLAIACSAKGPMPEVLGDAGVYFEPDSAISIAYALEVLLSNETDAKQLGDKASERSSKYSWGTCSSQTLEFLSGIHIRPERNE